MADIDSNDLRGLRLHAASALDKNEPDEAFSHLLTLFSHESQLSMADLRLMLRCADQLVVQHPTETSYTLVAYDKTIQVAERRFNSDLIDPKGLSPRVNYNIIDVLKLETNDQLASCKRGELLSLRNIGLGSIEEVYKYLEERGYRVNRCAGVINSDTMLADPSGENVFRADDIKNLLASARLGRERAQQTAQMIALAKGLGTLPKDAAGLVNFYTELREEILAKKDQPAVNHTI